MSDNNRGGSLRPWHTIAREAALDCRIFDVERVERQSASGDAHGTFYVIDSADWVNVMAITENEEMVMIRQYRHGTDSLMLEIPGGIVDEGESPIEAAERELLEETGYAGTKSALIGRVAANPAFMTNYSSTVLITGCRRSGPTKLDEHEEIEVVLHPVSEIEEMLLSGGVTHSFVALAFMWYELYRNGKPYRGNDPVQAP